MEQAPSNGTKGSDPVAGLLGRQSLERLGNYRERVTLGHEATAHLGDVALRPSGPRVTRVELVEP
ncbi:MAG: hypothetical protein L3J86_02520 [Thermoplasmata archaeon]|nr:hypothetical protein [Thermoplasmata archaeon]